MLEFILSIIIGLILVVIGFSNTKGNISTLHSYHIKRVKKEDILPFGKKVGMGSIIIGISIVIARILSILTELFQKTIYSYISNIILATGLTIGLILIIYALFKYNKGIF